MTETMQEVAQKKAGVRKPKVSRKRTAPPKPKNDAVRQPSAPSVKPFLPYENDPIQEGYDFAVKVIKEREEEIKTLRAQIAAAEADIAHRKLQAAAWKPLLKRKR